MTIDLLGAQCVLFFQAGFDTSSNTLGYLFFELAQNQDIQNKVREEINSLLDTYDGQVTYDLLKHMTYSEMVIAGTNFAKQQCSYKFQTKCTYLQRH